MSFVRKIESCEKYHKIISKMSLINENAIKQVFVRSKKTILLSAISNYFHKLFMFTLINVMPRFLVRIMIRKEVSSLTLQKYVYLACNCTFFTTDLTPG